MGKKSLQQSQERDLGLLLELPDELDTLIAERRFAQAVQLLQQGKYIFILMAPMFIMLISNIVFLMMIVAP